MALLKLTVANGNRSLGEAVARELSLNLDPEDQFTRFPDDEVQVHLGNVRGYDLFVLQTTQPPAENLLELLWAIDAAKRSGAERIVAFLPYFGYACQDRKNQPRVPISAKRVARMIEDAGADHVILFDIHSGQTQGFFEIPVDSVYARPELLKHLRELGDHVIYCAPDAGAMKFVHSYAKRTKAETVYADKVRLSPTQVETKIVGDVDGAHAVIIDDMVRTGETTCLTAEALKQRGAASVSVAAVHADLTEGASERIAAAPIDQFIVTNTLPISPERRAVLGDKLKVVDLAPFLARIIQLVHARQPLSNLFD